MQLTLYRTLCIHTLLLVGLGGYVVAHRRGGEVVPAKQVRMPTQAELLEIEHLRRQVGYSGWRPDSQATRKRGLALIDLQLRYMPPEHPEVVFHRHDLARSFEWSEMYVEAAEQYRVLVKTYERVMGVDAPETVEYQKKLKEMLRQQEKVVEAEQEHRKSYQKAVLALGHEDAEVLKFQAALASNLMSQSKYQEAERELRAMLDIQRRTQKDPYRLFARSLVSLTESLGAQGKWQAALEMVQELEWFLAESRETDTWWSDRVVSAHAHIAAARNKRKVKQEVRLTDGVKAR